jgi:hypothetical protein
MLLLLLSNIYCTNFDFDVHYYEIGNRLILVGKGVAKKDTLNRNYLKFSSLDTFSDKKEKGSSSKDNSIVYVKNLSLESRIRDDNKYIIYFQRNHALILQKAYFCRFYDISDEDFTQKVIPMANKDYRNRKIRRNFIQTKRNI